MKKTFVIGLIIGLSGLVYAQEQTHDSSTDLSNYFIDSFHENPYNIDLIDTVPGLNISLIPPEHFIFSDKIPGYIHPGTTASIQIKEIEGTSWPILDRVMTPDHFKSQGVEFISREEGELKSGLSAVFYVVRFEASGVPYERLIMFAGDYHNTIWINANYPVHIKKTVIKPIINSLLTANII